jgi:Ion channel
MSRHGRIAWVVTTLVFVPLFFVLRWNAIPYYNVEIPQWLDILLDLLFLPVVVLGALALVVYAIRDLRRTKSTWVALFGLYMLTAGAVVIIVTSAEVYKQDGLIQTVSTSCDEKKPELKTMDYIYFSIITWTTVGYGDLVPSSKSRITAAIEAIVGFLYMAAYVAYMVIVVTFLSEYDFSVLEKMFSDDANVKRNAAQGSDVPKT